MEKKLNTQHKDTRHDKGQFQKDSRGTKDGELVIDPTKYRYIRALKNSMVKYRGHKFMVKNSIVKFQLQKIKFEC